MRVPSIAGMNIGSAATALIAAIFSVVILAGRSVPLISGDREAFIALAVVGVLQCGIGMAAASVGDRGDWLNWANVSGAVMGIAAVLLIVAALTGRPEVMALGYREAFLALTLLMLAKWSLHRIYFLLTPA